MGHIYEYGICVCGIHILPQISYDGNTGSVTLVNIPEQVVYVLVSVNNGEQMLWCAFIEGGSTFEIPASVLEQASSINIYYLDDHYAPVLLSGTISL